MKQNLQLKLSNQLTMTPQLQQAIRLLQLSTLELQQEISAALETNPLLEVDQEMPEHPSIYTLTANNKNKSQTSDQFDILTQNRVQEETLYDHLVWQLRFSTLTPVELTVAYTVIDAITDEGYLPLSNEEIQEIVGKTFRIAQNDIESVIQHIQQFEPAGIGARSLEECLVLQLKRHEENEDIKQLAIEIIRNDLSLLAQHDYSHLKRSYRLTDGLLLEIVKLIKSLNPKPGLAFDSQQTEYLIPDLLVYKAKNVWEVMLNPDTSPKVRINTIYTDLIKHSHKKTDQVFLKEHLQDAKWLLKSLENRFDTLLKVGQAIIARQQDFLEFGEEAMKPLVLSDIALEVEMHESTISRITTQKYVHTHRGVFELKYFFSSHVHMQHGGECSSTAIRALIKKLVAAENPKQPLSDSKLANILKEQGINIARRTIAKYRESLFIASSNDRKRQYWPKEGQHHAN